MSKSKILAQIHSLKEISKGNYIIELEVVSIDDNGLVPNIDFFIKAGGRTKKRTTNNQGIFKNEEFFESKKELTEIQLLDTNKKLVSTYYLPSYTSIENKEQNLKYEKKIEEIVQENKNNISIFKEQSIKDISEKDTIISNLNTELSIEKKTVTKLEERCQKLLNEISVFKPNNKIIKGDALIGKEKYKTVQIGDKLWMKDTLKFPVKKGLIIDNGVYYYNLEAVKSLSEHMFNDKNSWVLPNSDDLSHFTQFIKKHKKKGIILSSIFHYFDYYREKIRFVESEYGGNYQTIWYEDKEFKIFHYRNKKDDYSWCYNELEINGYFTIQLLCENVL